MLSSKTGCYFIFTGQISRLIFIPCMAWVWLFLLSVLDSAMILFIVYKAKTPYNDLYSLQVMHTREGRSQREAPLMKHSCRGDLSMTPATSIRRLFLKHTWPCWKSKLTSPTGEPMPPGE